jgi:hypothetical protein
MALLMGGRCLPENKKRKVEINFSLQDLKKAE